MCVPIVFLSKRNHLFETNVFLLRGISLPTLPQISQTTRRSWAEMQKKTRKYNNVEKQKRTICVFKCWLNWQLLKLCCHLKKTINDPTPSWSAVPFVRLGPRARSTAQCWGDACSHVGSSHRYCWSTFGGTCTCSFVIRFKHVAVTP